MGSRGRGRNTGRVVNFHQTLIPQVHHDIDGIHESIGGNLIMAVIEMNMKPLDTEKVVLMENKKLCKRQRTSMNVLEEG